MSGYRFCRTDDIPLLVRAFNDCWTPHFGSDRAITVERFKRDVRAINLWASSSMLAMVDDEPVGVLLGAKREDGNLVHRIAVKPGHARHGHGRHLLESLRQKIAILGPPRLTAEIPASCTGARSFFERCGFSIEARYVDFVATAPPPSPAASTELIAEVTLDDCLEAGAIERSVRRSWSRALRTLENRRSELAGLAIASDVRFEAYVLFFHRPDGCQIAALGESHVGLLEPLVARLWQTSTGALRIPETSEDEISFASLERLGFRRAGETLLYGAAPP